MRSVAGSDAHMPYMRATDPRSHRFVNYLMAVNFRSICFLYLFWLRQGASFFRRSRPDHHDLTAQH
jgi:hypothetical protein